MSQQKKLELSERIREFRGRSKLSQEELGERLGVSGNYISMMELGKKAPGSSLRKLFETLELSPLYRDAGEASVLLEDSGGSSVSYHGGKQVPQNPLFAMLATETLIQTFGDVTGKLVRGDAHEQKQAIGSLREMLDEIERRLLASSGGLSEAQRMAVKAANAGGSPGTR